MPVANPADFVPAFTKCFDAADIDGLLDLYSDEIVAVAEPGSRLNGKDGLKAALEGFLAMKPSPLQFPVLGVVEGENTAMAYGDWSVEGTGPDGPVQLGGRATIVLRRGDGGWSAVLDDFFCAG